MLVALDIWLCPQSVDVLFVNYVKSKNNTSKELHLKLDNLFTVLVLCIQTDFLLFNILCYFTETLQSAQGRIFQNEAT